MVHKCKFHKYYITVYKKTDERLIYVLIIYVMLLYPNTLQNQILVDYIAHLLVQIKAKYSWTKVLHFLVFSLLLIMVLLFQTYHHHQANQLSWKQMIPQPTFAGVNRKTPATLPSTLTFLSTRKLTPQSK